MRYAFSRRLFSTVFVSTLFLSTHFVVAAFAQSPDTVTLPPVVVTATRIPIAPGTASASITVISGASLRAQGITTVADALRLVPGAAVAATGSFGGQTSLFVRGGESDYVKVLIDGVPQNQPGGFYDFANLGTEDVDRIEIVRGPVSVLYGSDAVAGVVQVFTRSGPGGGAASGRLAFGGGSYGTEWGSGAMSESAGSFGWGVTLSRRTTDGTYPVNSNDRRSLAGASLRFAPDARGEVRLSVRYADALFHFPTDATGQVADSDQHTSDRGPSVALEIARTFSTRWDAAASLAWHREESRYDDGADSPGDTSVFCCFHSRDVLQRLVAGGRASLHVSSGAVVTAGVERELQRQSGSTLDTTRGNSAAYAQLLGDLGHAVSITAGTRLDKNQQFGDHLTGRAGVAWRPDGRTRLRASVGTGFKEPSFFENFATGFARGNAGLRPERSTSWEVGVERTVRQGRLALQATWFDQRFRDFIQYSAAPLGPDSVNYVNIGDATARGLELSIRTALGRGFSVEAAYTYLRSRDEGTGRRLQRRPTHAGALQVFHSLADRGSVGLSARYSGDREDRDFAVFPDTAVTLPAQAVLDASAEFRLSRGRGALPGLVITGRVENLLDARYEEALYFPAPRRTVLVGGALTFGR
jgi:vitamin B12 transporter